MREDASGAGELADGMLGSDFGVNQVLKISSVGGTASESVDTEIATSLVEKRRKGYTRNGSIRVVPCRETDRDESHGMNVHRTKASMTRQDESAVVQTRRRADKQTASKAERLRIADIARSTRSPAIRNAAALLLADLHVEGARGILVALLKRRGTKNHRGTLLYALEELNADVPLLLLVDVIAKDGYEAKEQALDLIGNGQSVGTAEELDKARSRLTVIARSKDVHASRSAKLALDYLRGEA
jgi:hypothetical protein